MYTGVIKPERHSRRDTRKKECDFDGRGEAG